MSRIIYASGFEQQLTSAQDMLKRHEQEGNSSAIKPLLAQKNIDLAADVAAGTAAYNHEASRQLLTQQKQNYCELRDLKGNGPLAALKGCYQFLKSFYKPNYKALAEWGATIDGNGKISYPADFAARVAAYRKLKQKHDMLAENDSPLLPFLVQNKIDLDADNIQLNSAMDYHDKYMEAAKAAEVETQKRDQLWAPVNAHIREIGDYLKKLYKDNDKQLGLWGFTIDNSPRQPKERTSTILPDDKLFLTGLVLGSTLTNTGTTDLHIYAGKNTTGNPIIVAAGANFGVRKGFSNLTISNPSLLEKAVFKALILR